MATPQRAKTRWLFLPIEEMIPEPGTSVVEKVARPWRRVQRSAALSCKDATTGWEVYAGPIYRIFWPSIFPEHNFLVSLSNDQHKLLAHDSFRWRFDSIIMLLNNDICNTFKYSSNTINTHNRIIYFSRKYYKCNLSQSMKFWNEIAQSLRARGRVSERRLSEAHTKAKATSSSW